MNNEADEGAHGGRENRPPGDLDLLHELEVHRVELGLQNEELRRGEIELEASREAYRRLYDRAPVGYVTLDSRGRCLDANPKAAELLGVSLAAMRTRPLQAHLGRAAADELHRHLQRVFGDIGGGRCELAVARTGAAPWLQIDSVLVIEPDGKRIAHVSLTDVSERKRMLEELRVLNQYLERRVLERTEALSNANRRLERELAERRRVEAQLLEARKMEAIGRLAGGVAHDFNNLLTVMRLDTAVLAADAHEREPRIAASVNALSFTIERAAELVGKLLVFARRDAAREQALEIGSVVAQLRGTLERLAAPPLELQIEVAHESVWVSIDRSGFEQVLVNLVVNARDAISGAGRIGITVEEVTVGEPEAARLAGATPGRYARLTVRDSGRGMNPEEQARMFEPFYSTKGAARGGGLGLATAYGIVTGCGGFFDVESAPGRGTSFAVYLPRVAAPAVDARAAQIENRSRGQVEAKAQGPARGDRLLVVDDHEALRRGLSALLTAAGYRVLQAADGEQALALLAAQEGRVDLVLCDIVMPGMNGVEVEARVRSTWPGIPVVFMSGYAAEERIPAGARYVQKPFQPEALLREIREALEAAGGTEEVALAP